MSVIDGKSYQDPRNINLKGGARGTGLLRWTPPQSGVPALWSSNPFSSTDYGLYINASGQLVFSSTGSTTILGAAGASSVPSWEQIYANDKTLAVTSTTFTIDGQHASNNVLTLTNTGAGSGVVLQITNAGTGKDIQGDSSTWSVTKLGLALFSDINTPLITTSANLLISGAGAAVITIGANSNTITLAKAVTFSSTVVVTDGLTDLISTSNTAAALRITNNTATTLGNGTADLGVAVIRSTSLTTGDLLRLQTDASLSAGSGNYLNLYDTGLSSSVFSITELGVTVIAGLAGSDSFTLTAGDVSFADASLTIVDADDAATLSITNSTATTATIFKFIGAGAFTGTTTAGWMTMTAVGLTTGTMLYMSANGLTTGEMLWLAHTTSVIADGGSMLRIASTSIDTGGSTNGTLLDISSTAQIAGVTIKVATALTTGTAMLISSSAALTTTGNLLTLTANSATTGAGIFRINGDALTSGIGAVIASSATAITGAGRLLYVNHTGTTSSTGTLVEFATAAVDVTNATTLLKLTMGAAIVGVGLSVVSTTALTTGSLIRVSTATAGALATNGVVSIRGTGAFTSTANIGLLDVSSDALVGTGTLVNFQTSSASQLTNTILNVEQSGVTTSYTGTMVRIKATTTTGAGTVVALIADGITSGGTAMSISVAALTTGDGLVITNGTAATTTGSLLKVTAGGTGAVSSDGIVSFAHTGVYTSTTVGFLNVIASATTAGTLATFTSSAMTTGTNLQISSVGITSGKHFNVLGAAGASHFSIGVNGLTTIAGSASGTDALVITAGDILVTSGHIDLTSGNLTLASGTLTVSGAVTFSSTLLYKTFTEVVTTTNVILAAESGTTFFLNAAGGFTSTLPAPAAGLNFSFVVQTAPTGASYIITTNAGANVLKGKIVERAGGAGVAGTGQDVINFVLNQAIAGDTYNFACDGTTWFITGVVDVSAACTFAVT